MARMESTLGILGTVAIIGPFCVCALGAGSESMSNAEPMKHRADYDPTVMEAFREGRHADDIYVVYCSDCKAWSYWNQGSHCNCRFCLADLDDEDAITMADYWDDAPYPYP